MLCVCFRATFIAIAVFISTPLIDAASFTPIPLVPGMSEGRAFGLSSDGQSIVGISHGLDTQRAFRWQVDDAVPTIIADLPGGEIANEATAISADGTVVVGQASSNFGDEAFSLVGEAVPEAIGDLAEGFYSSRATSASANGSIVVGTGHSMMGREAFRWSSASGIEGMGFLQNGVASEASDVSDDGSVVVGVSETFDAILGEAFRWSRATGMVGLGDLPGGDLMSRATATSPDGAFVVGASNSSRGVEAFRWTEEAGMVGLGDLAGGAFDSIAYDVSSSGNRIVGMGRTDDANSVAFIWSAVDGMRSLSEVLVDDFGLADGLNGWHLLSANAITPDGDVVIGTGINPSGTIQGFRAELDIALPIGDLNRDGETDERDIEMLFTGIRTGTNDRQFDLNGDGHVNLLDRNYMIHEVIGTFFGDVNLDGEFQSSDFVRVFMAGEYEDGISRNSTWPEGDWNGDGDFTSSDFILAFQDGGYEQGPRMAVAVPEPASVQILILSLTAVVGLTRRCRRPERRMPMKNLQR